MMNDRAQHLEWCKKRAFVLCDRGQAEEALHSMLANLETHPETAGDPAIAIVQDFMRGGQLTTEREVRDFIEAFG
jgi:hypothetical protein